MNLFFSILSAIYIFAIFFWADSSAISQISIFNPFSLLHIPLYGILTILLALTLGPGPKASSRRRYALVALIALAVAILDEMHQYFIPNRDASIMDVFLDALGISLGLYFFHRFSPFFRPSFSNKLRKDGIEFVFPKGNNIKAERRKS